MRDQESEEIICRCEEVTDKEIREVIRSGKHTMNSVKRATRAGMGLCQGKMCAKLVSRLIVEETGKKMAELAPFSVRPPVRPITIADMVLKGEEER